MQQILNKHHSNGSGSIPTDGTSGLFIQKGEIVDVLLESILLHQIVITPKEMVTLIPRIVSLQSCIYATVDSNVQAEKTKTLVSASCSLKWCKCKRFWDCINKSPNDRIANGQFIVAPFTGTQSLQISDVFQINSIIEGVASSGTAATQFTTALMRLSWYSSNT